MRSVTILPFFLCSYLQIFPSIYFVSGFSASSSSSTSPSSSSYLSSKKFSNKNNVLILDHLNINHEKGRHDWVKAFYFDFLQCVVDPRKAENIQKGTKTLWANIGAHQFHLPEGKPSAQVLQGVVTLVYPNVDNLLERYNNNDKGLQSTLTGSKFSVTPQGNDALIVIDPWGTQIKIVSGSGFVKDPRGSQPGGESLGLGMSDLTIYTPMNCNMKGIARFYETVLGAPAVEISDKCCIVSVGPQQTLTFLETPNPNVSIAHEDLRNDNADDDNDNDIPKEFPSNYGPHISMYVADLPTTYQNADALGVAYVNPRFKRRAFNLEEAIDDCMFRCLDIVDPENVQDGPILKLEHEIRSVVKRDGSKYKSCPFNEIPAECKTM